MDHRSLDRKQDRLTDHQSDGKGLVFHDRSPVRFPRNRDKHAFGAVQASLQWTPSTARRLTGPGRRAGRGFRPRLRYRCRGQSSDRILFVLTVVVLLLLAAEGFVLGGVGRAWMAIRGMDFAAETIGIPRCAQNCSLAFEIDRSVQTLIRKEVSGVGLL
jgi:hypothetical protein